MNKKLFAILIAFVICLFTIDGFAQESQEPETYQDSTLSGLEFETTEYVPQKAPYFALGGGYVGSFMFNKFQDLNNMIKSAGFKTDKFKSPVYLSGASFLRLSALSKI